MDFKECLKKAHKRLEESNKEYGSYKEHIEKYIVFKSTIEQGLKEATGNSKSIEKRELIEHATHSLALKLARIQANTYHEDSYIDVFGYLLLFMKEAGIQKITFQECCLLDQNHIINCLIRFINKMDLSRKQNVQEQ